MGGYRAESVQIFGIVTEKLRMQQKEMLKLHDSFCPLWARQLSMRSSRFGGTGGTRREWSNLADIIMPEAAILLRPSQPQPLEAFPSSSIELERLDDHNSDNRLKVR